MTPQERAYRRGAFMAMRVVAKRVGREGVGLVAVREIDRRLRAREAEERARDASKK